ncbi:hypothetical protein ACQ4LE_010291 [Meloidogyne hapla]
MERGFFKSSFKLIDFLTFSLSATQTFHGIWMIRRQLESTGGGSSLGGGISFPTFPIYGQNLRIQIISYNTLIHQFSYWPASMDSGIYCQMHALLEKKRSILPPTKITSRQMM